MSYPTAVLIADVHYNINTLELADKAMRLAISKANELNVPFIVAGDLHDTKAHLRGECVRAIIKTFTLCKTKAYVIVGNHCRINEKSEDHSLDFLAPYATIVSTGRLLTPQGLFLIPYYSRPEALQEVLKSIPVGSTIVCHQGVQTAFMGHYTQDKSSLPKESFADYRVMSGHYHTRQDIKCGRPQKGAVGLFSYIGNPYTLTYGESQDPPKGFQVLHDNGLLKFVPTNLRRHWVFETTPQEAPRCLSQTQPGDLVRLKIKGPQSELAKYLKPKGVKVDLIPTDADQSEVKADTMTEAEILDSIIDTSGETQEQKALLKRSWRAILSE